MRSLTFQALKITQPIGDFFIGVLAFSDLTQISWADIRRMEDEREFEKYLGIQRPLNKTRVADLRTYVQAWDATFPSCVILAVEECCAVWDPDKSQLTLSEWVDEHGDIKIKFDRIAKILDGQHRVAGLQTYSGDRFDVPVAIFVGADIAQQASIFGTVNLAQTKVHKSLVYDLYDLAKARSPQKTCHNVAVGLDRAEDSPLHKRIKRLGVATPGRENETITQATFVESLLPYLSAKPGEDRDKLIRRKKLEKADETVLKKQIFRNLFINELDDDIGKIIWSYFAAVKKRWPTVWDDLDENGKLVAGNILPKTNGFRALMRFLRPAYLASTDQIGSRVTADEFGKIFSKIKLEKTDFNIEKFPPGTSGESRLLIQLLTDSGLDSTLVAS